MQNITINNSTVYININEDTVSNAKSQLLEKLYYARNKDTMGGYEAWLQLLDWYYMGAYNKMIEHIKSCKGKGGATRAECLRYINTIMKGEN